VASDKPFRLTMFLTNGEERTFPIYQDAGIAGAKRAALWPDGPFGPNIIDKLEDRDILFGALVRLYTHIARKGEGTFYLTDDDGKEWGVPGKHVMAIRLEDPESSSRKRRVGFAFDRVEGDVS
jgi:hypothetical protein